jgi:hypothetical protein
MGLHGRTAQKPLATDLPPSMVLPLEGQEQ